MSDERHEGYKCLSRHQLLLVFTDKHLNKQFPAYSPSQIRELAAKGPDAAVLSQGAQARRKQRTRAPQGCAESAETKKGLN